jgi:hypothetical protein
MLEENLPEFYISDDGQRIAEPMYEALTQCQMNMTSAETGQTGPTLIEVGEHFKTADIPCHQWRPLNRAAGERIEQWIASLPLDGKNIPQELITEAAYQLRPREGDPEFPMEQWWPQVLRLAAKMADAKRGRAPMPTVGFRSIGPNTPPMPFSSMSSAYPTEAGRAPSAAQHQPQNPANAAARARAARVRPPMPNATPASSPVGEA